MIYILNEDVEPIVNSSFVLIDQVLKVNRKDVDLDYYREKARYNNDNFYINNSLLTRFGKLVILKGDNLRTKLIREIYNRLTTTYPGRNKTSRLL